MIFYFLYSLSFYLHFFFLLCKEIKRNEAKKKKETYSRTLVATLNSFHFRGVHIEIWNGEFENVLAGGGESPIYFLLFAKQNNKLFLYYAIYQCGVVEKFFASFFQERREKRGTIAVPLIVRRFPVRLRFRYCSEFFYRRNV